MSSCSICAKPSSRTLASCLAACLDVTFVLRKVLELPDSVIANIVSGSTNICNLCQEEVDRCKAVNEQLIIWNHEWEKCKSKITGMVEATRKTNLSTEGNHNTETSLVSNADLNTDLTTEERQSKLLFISTENFGDAAGQGTDFQAEDGHVDELDKSCGAHNDSIRSAEQILEHNHVPDQEPEDNYIVEDVQENLISEESNQYLENHMQPTRDQTDGGDCGNFLVQDPVTENDLQVEHTLGDDQMSEKSNASHENLEPVDVAQLPETIPDITLSNLSSSEFVNELLQDNTGKYATADKCAYGTRLRSKRLQAGELSEACLSKKSKSKGPYTCTLCNKTFTSKTYLGTHQQLHLKIKLFNCKLCNKAFGDMCHLKRHIRCYHLKEKPYKCKICNKDFTTNEHLQDHTKTHVEEKPYSCTGCSYRAKWERNLKKHQRLQRCATSRYLPST